MCHKNGWYHSVQHKNERFLTKMDRPFNPHIPNIVDISGAIFTLRIQYEYTQTQCNEGARYGIDIWYMGINIEFVRYENP